MQCGTAVAMRYEAPNTIAIPLRCKQWDCEDCGPRRKRRLIAEVLSGSPLTFITLTNRYDPGINPNTQAVAMSHAFQKLVKRIRRRPATPEFEYVAIFEKTKRGWPHLHILTRTPYISKNWVSNNWKELTGAFIIDIRKINDPTIAARYVAKYVGKAPHHFQGTKRYRFSQAYRPPLDGDQANTPVAGLDWQILPINLLAVHQAWSKLGYTITENEPHILLGKPAALAATYPFNGIQMNSPSESFCYAQETLAAAQQMPLAYAEIPAD